MNENKSYNKSNKIPIEEYAESKLIKSEILKKSKSGVILLPNNKILHRSPENENQFTPITKDVLLTFKDKKINASLYDDGKEKSEITLRSAETNIIFPILIFTEYVILPTVMSILGNWIYDKFIKNNSDSPHIKMEYGCIDLQKDIIETYKLEGTAEEVQKLINNKFKENPIKLTKSNKNCESSQEISENPAQKPMKIANELIGEAKESIYINEMEKAESLLRKSLEKIREAFLLTRG